MKNKAQKYLQFVEQKTPASPVWRNTAMAFLWGGALCTVGEAVRKGLIALGVTNEHLKSWVPIIMIFLGAFLTALGGYDKLARHALAGAIIPITGFANSVASCAMEFKTEGFVLGVGAKMFTIAGPVIVYGTVASVVYGMIYWITTLF